MKKMSVLFLIFTSSFSAQDAKRIAQEKIIDQFAVHCAQESNDISNMKNWQDCLDMGLKQDSTIAYLGNRKRCPILRRVNINWDEIPGGSCEI
ncbi:hypothetical protein [Flavobacterium pallidum]|uniref:Uncharacterized protein n=1 Tax=Flavobacterium pallidum TaxID=2172098 RepID=A0A2S1SIW3_9FLAO|nr:hypothetical protein [Flavobacterium pallidum]AWI26321.1 hypothetical protein HYN49_10645 [Flavobacterium pallidum]